MMRSSRTLATATATTTAFDLVHEILLKSDHVPWSSPGNGNGTSENYDIDDRSATNTEQLCAALVQHLHTVLHSHQQHDDNDGGDDNENSKMMNNHNPSSTSPQTPNFRSIFAGPSVTCGDGTRTPSSAYSGAAGIQATSSIMARLTSILIEGMAARVTNTNHTSSDRLPTTTTSTSDYDDDDDHPPQQQQSSINHAEENTESIITLTPLSLTCAELYGTLLTIPGALGAGLVDVGALQAMAAVLERWAMEYQVQEANFATPSSVSEIDAAQEGKKSRSTRPNQNRNARLKPALKGNMRHSKRSQKAVSLRRPGLRSSNRPSADYDSSTTEDEEDNTSDGYNDDLDDPYLIEMTDQPPVVRLTSAALLQKGLQVFLQVAQLPTSRDFFSWSEEARDVILSSTATAMSVSSALYHTYSSSSSSKLKFPKNLLEKIASVLQRSSTSLVQCVTLTSSDQLSSEVLIKRTQSTKAIVKGLHPLLLLQRHDLPAGAKGRHAAAEEATVILEKFLQEVITDMKYNPNSWPKQPMEASHNTRTSLLSPDFTSPTASAHTLHTPTTNNKSKRRRTPFNQNRRLSVGDGGDKPTTPLRLKPTSTTDSLISPNLHYPTSNIVSKMTNAKNMKPRPVLNEVLALLQRLCLDPSNETTSVRQRVVDTVRRCLPQLPVYERSLLLACLSQLIHCKWWYCRVISVEVSIYILNESWFWDEINNNQAVFVMETPVPSNRRTATSTKSPLIDTTPRSRRSIVEEDQCHNVAEGLLEGLIQRFDDKDRNLRSTCANGLASLLHTIRSESTNDYVRDKVVWLLSKQSRPLVRVLRESCMHEDKALTKKALIGALVELLIAAKEIPELVLDMTDDDVHIIERFCHDSSQETQRAAVEALTTLLETCQDSSHGNEAFVSLLEVKWVECVLPLSLESDNRLATKILELFDRIVLVPVMEGRSNQSLQSAWRIVSIAAERSICIDSVRTLIHRKVSDSASKGDVLSPLITRIADFASASVLKNDDDHVLEPNVLVQRDGAWYLFKALLASSANLPKFISPLRKIKRGLGLVVNCWHKLVTTVNAVSNHDDNSLRTLGYCLEIIRVIAPYLDLNDAQDAARSIEEYVTTFLLPKSLIGVAVNALTYLTVAQSDTNDVKGAQHLCSDKIRYLFDISEKEIDACVRVRRNVTEDFESRLVRALYTVGELCLVGFSEEEDKSSTNEAIYRSSKSDLVVGVYVRPSSRLVQLVQTLLATCLPSSMDSLPTPAVVRSVAFLTLGKICLRCESLTAKSVTLFARELHEAGNGSSEVQANALVVLGDLCVRYANRVDRFLPLMASCMQSGVSSDFMATTREGFNLVRIQAVYLLSNLIMQDFVKWRGLLFHRFLVAATDQDVHVAIAAEKMLCGPLLRKRPNLFMQNFVESVFVLNRCTTHPIYQAASINGDGGSGAVVDFDGIHLDGSMGSARRHFIYKLMLSKMSDEQKVGVTARLAKDVLGNALEQGNDLYRLCQYDNPEGLDLEVHAVFGRPFHVIRDSLTVLRSKLSRVSSRRKDDDAKSFGTTGEVESRRDQVATLKGEFLSNINRTQLIEIIIPILVKLKNTLQKNRSPLLKDLMGYLLVVHESFPDKVREILRSEPQILLEVEHDARHANRKKNVLKQTNGSIVI